MEKDKQKMYPVNRTLLLVTLMLLLPWPIMAQYVASDACGFAPANNYTVDEGCTPRAFHKPASYTATYNPGTCGAGAYADAYGWFTATSTSTTLNFAPHNDADPVLHVFTGTCGTLTLVDCANDKGPWGSENLVIPTVIGQQYLIRVQTIGSNAPMADSQICIYNTPPPPPNDEPCSAIFLTATSNCTNVVSATNTSATVTPGIPDPGCYYGGEADIWYTALVPSSGHILVDSYAPDGSGPGDSGMAIYSAAACDQPMSLIDCNDDKSPTDHMPAIDRYGLIPGDTIYVRFWAFYGGDGSFSICASPDGSTLPVELTSFSATAENGSVKLHWTTATEKNSDHFTVERSSDNISFQPVGRLPAAGNSQASLAYALADRKPMTGWNYYRLHQVDMDGTSELSQVVACWAEPRASAIFYPNPVSDELTIEFRQDLPAGTKIWVSGVVNRSISEVDIKQLGGEQRTLKVDTHALTPGTYFIRMVSAQGEVSMIGSFMKL